MNDRIQQLLLQVASRTGEDGEYLPSLHTPQDIERFAELIVRECARVVNNNDFDGSQVGNRMLFEHFGVEE